MPPRLALLACVVLALLPAQTPTATLVGKVEDPTRAAIAGAAIRARNTQTGEIRTAESTIDGSYTISNLPPGRYDVAIEKPGFRLLRETGLDLQIDESARLDARLEIGAQAESIQVKAEVPLLNTESGSRGDVIVTQELTEMPLDGRNFEDLAFLVVGVQPSEQGSKGTALSMNGARADSGNYLVDGFNDQNPRDAGAQARPPLEALQEFKVQTSGYSAEYGRLAGGVINMVLKTGGNQLHGSAFEFVRNDLFDARNFFDAGKSELRRNQFGATLTGPVAIPKLYDGRDKTFFLASWESYRQVSGSNAFGVVPTALERAGDFSHTIDASGKPVVVKDPLGSTFPGAKIPLARFHPVSQNLLAYYPLPDLPGQANNFQANANSLDNWDNFLFKVDQKVAAKDNVSFRAVERWEQKTDPFGGSNLGTFGSITDSSQTLFGASWTRIFTPSLINELRGGFTRTTDHERGVHAGHNFAADLGIPGVTADPHMTGFPKITITNFLTLGDSGTTPIDVVVNTYQYTDTLTWVKAKHLVKIGGEALRVQFFQPTNSDFRGTFAFQSKNTGVPFADFLLGMLNSSSRKLGTVTNYIFNTNYGAFVQDDYKVLPNLTLNLGLRYEIQKPPLEKNGQMTNYIPALGKIILAGDRTAPNLQAMLAATGLSGLVGLASTYGLPASLVDTNYLNFAPRVGAAWRPFGDNRTVVRSGYGIFYGGQRLNPIRTDLTGGYPFSVSQTFARPAGNPNLLTFSNPFPDSLAKVQGVTNTNGYDLHAPTQYLQSWNFTVEREIGRGVAVEAGYVGSKGTHLGRKYDMNQAYRLPALQLPDGSFPKPVPGLGSVNYYGFGSNSSYNAATLSLRKRLTAGVFFRVNYTYGKSIDDASGLNYAGDGGYAGAQDARDLKAERGRSDFDIGHSFSMNFTWQLPFRQSRLLRGWQLAGTGRMYTGQPFTPQTQTGSVNLGEPTRPDRVAKGTLANPSPARWFDLAAFPVVPLPAYRFGDSGRNILDGPGFVGINLALARRFRISERAAAQFRWETFNTTNHTNFRLPNVNVDVTNAATITEAQPGREMQLGLRLQF